MGILVIGIPLLLVYKKYRKLHYIENAVLGYSQSFFKSISEFINHKKSPAEAGLKYGAPSETRTPDTLIKSQVLCRLS